MIFETISREEGTLNRRVHARHETFQEAWTALLGRSGLIMAEVDGDHEGHADAFFSSGQLLAIEMTEG